VPRRRARLPWLLAALVAGWTLLTFLPTIENGFVNWDDPRMFLENPYHRGPWSARLQNAWGRHLLGEFMPVTWMSYGLDFALWDLNAAGYHLTSVLLHALAALAVYALARRLLRHALGDAPGRDPAAVEVGAALAALAFAVHPLRLEPVAWVSARGTVLGGLFLVLAVLVYVVGWERGRGRGRVPTTWLAGSALLFVASLLSRATGLVLPGVLLVLDVYPLRRLAARPAGWWGPAAARVWAEKALFLVIGALALPMGFLARGEEAGDFHRAGWDPLVALATAVYSAGFYVWKTVGIGISSPIYRMPAREDPMPLWVLASALTAGVISWIVVAARRRWPGALAAWVAYLILLAPMSGIVPFGRLRGAVDRYTYVACIGWALLAGGAAAVGWQRWKDGRASRLRAVLAAAAVVGVLLGWSIVSRREAAVWRDGVTLWTRAVAVVPASPLARTNLGTALAARGDFAGAAAQYREALREWGSRAGALQNLGRALAHDGKPAEAVEPLRRVVELRPTLAEAHLDLGIVLHNLGRVDEAIAAFSRAVELAPGSARANESLGIALWHQGRKAEAARHLQRGAALRSGMLGSGDLAVPPPGADAGGS
jgi:Tfp pilus assembly protein PilF